MTGKPDRQIFHCDCNSFYASVDDAGRAVLSASGKATFSR
jgi:nucleotidyltransferase/DNA polymerase involved in DNA repair